MSVGLSLVLIQRKHGGVTIMVALGQVNIMDTKLRM